MVVWHSAFSAREHSSHYVETIARPTLSGGHIEGDTPVPIPNTVVKPLRADDTAWVTAWESRTPPELK